jgi:signal peptidase I
VNTSSRSVSGRNRIAWLLILAIVGLPIAIYLANPLRTGSRDARARVLGLITFRVASGNMEPTLRKDDIVLINVWAYARTDPVAGDIVAYQVPGAEGSTIARVVATAGSEVRIADGIVLVDGVAVREPWRHRLPPDPDETVMNADAIRIRPGYLFAMSDNPAYRGHGLDVGHVQRGQVIGRFSRRLTGDEAARGDH